MTQLGRSNTTVFFIFYWTPSNDFKSVGFAVQIENWTESHSMCLSCLQGLYTPVRWGALLLCIPCCMAEVRKGTCALELRIQAWLLAWAKLLCWWIKICRATTTKWKRWLKAANKPPSDSLTTQDLQKLMVHTSEGKCTTKCHLSFWQRALYHNYFIIS